MLGANITLRKSKTLRKSRKYDSLAKDTEPSDKGFLATRASDHHRLYGVNLFMWIALPFLGIIKLGMG